MKLIKLPFIRVRPVGHAPSRLTRAHPLAEAGELTERLRGLLCDYRILGNLLIVQSFVLVSTWDFY